MITAFPDLARPILLAEAGSTPCPEKILVALLSVFHVSSVLTAAPVLVDNMSDSSLACKLLQGRNRHSPNSGKVLGKGRC